jgi:ferritin-like metal-binding protein YciE
MHDADDVYMGYAGKDEIVALLDELLEAERAAARVLRKMLPRVRDDALRGTLEQMKRSHEADIALIDRLMAGISVR